MTIVVVNAAQELAHDLLRHTPERWTHTQGVGRRAEELADSLLISGHRREVLISSAWLHDIGYSPLVRRSGFHPLDGAWHLDREGWPSEVTACVAHHSGARFVADVRGLSTELGFYRFDDSPVMDLLTYADQTVGPHGVRLDLEARMADMLRRHGPNSPNARAHPRRSTYLRAVAERVQEWLNELQPGLHETPRLP
jgi:hypothetical protein